MTSLTPVVTVVDNDASVRAQLESLIRSAGWAARPFASAAEFLDCPRSLIPGCLVADIALPDLDGLELQRRVADRAELPIIFMTRNFDISTTVRAMKAGAFEFMTKPFREDAMLSALGAGIEHSRAALGRETELHSLYERYRSLSCRERQVMALVVQGRMNKVIAAELGISEITVKAHRGKVMLKMRVRSVAELVIIAARFDTNVQLPIIASALRVGGRNVDTKVLSNTSNRFGLLPLM